MAETDPDAPPFGIFRILYSLITWTGFLVTVAILGWVMWTLFANTSAGTTRSQRLDLVRPTLTALAASQPVEDEPAGPASLPQFATCKACHTIAGTDAAGKVGPELTHAGTQARARIGAADYTGEATTPEEYILESLEEPSAFIVPGPVTYRQANGKSVMPEGLTAKMSPQEIDALVEALGGLE